MKNWQILLLGIFFGLLSAGAIILITLPPRGEPLTLTNSFQETSIKTPSASPTLSFILVHIAGEVQNPGIWSLPVGSRISDGILAAGGMTDIADPNRINLAAQLTDGTKVYVPSQGETLPNDVFNNGQTDAFTIPININLAGLEELCILPGIGSTKAQAIIDYRTTNGFFLEVSEILEVPGIGEVIYNQIKDMITVK